MASPFSEGGSPAASDSSVEAAFEALRRYDHGSSRGSLVPLDRAIAECEGDGNARQRCETRLLKLLDDGVSPVAREYICAKLAMIGSDRSVTALIASLREPQASTAAMTALRVIPGPAVAKALLAAIPKFSTNEMIGAIRILGGRRQAGCEGGLARLFRNMEPQAAVAAAKALGEIGSVKAANALKTFLPVAPPALRVQVADACLVCAENLRVAGNTRSAKALWDLLSSANVPEHMRAAASRAKAQSPSA